MAISYAYCRIKYIRLMSNSYCGDWLIINVGQN
jgi:hypothetical protein